MDASIHERLLHAEDNFFSAAAATGDGAIQAFEMSWSVLQKDIHNASHSQCLSSDTLKLVYATASRVGKFADTFLDFHVMSDALTSSFQSELEGIMARVTLGDETHVSSLQGSSPSQPSNSCTSQSSTKFTINSSPAPPCGSSPYPPYIAPAHRWLLKNIHNPYPSKETRELISKSTGTSVQNVNAWFMNIRRRMGWTTLMNKHFRKSRSDMLDAAYRAFVQEDPKRPLGAHLQMEFVVVEVTAKDLYSEKLEKSALAGKLDVMVKDMTPGDRLVQEETKAQTPEERKRRRENEKIRKQEAKDRNARVLSYPSPDHSPHSSSKTLPSLISDESDDDLTMPEPVAGCKRRSSPPASILCNLPADRPNKRHRTDFTSTADISNTSLPSPLSSSEGSLNTFDNWSSTSPESAPSPYLAAPPALSYPTRKRRLSDADTQGAPKRPRNLPTGPRLQAVSDPLPISTAIMEASQFDSWFQHLFDTPTAIVEELDSSLPLEVEVYDYSSSSSGTIVECISPNAIQNSVSPPSQTMEPHAVDATFPAGDNQACTTSADGFGLPMGPVELEIFNWPSPIEDNRVVDHLGQKFTDSTTHPTSESHPPPSPFNITSLEDDYVLNSLEGLPPLPVFPPTQESRCTSEPAAPLPPPLFSDPNWDQLLSYLPSSDVADGFSIKYELHQLNNFMQSFDPTLFPFSNPEVPSVDEARAEKQRKLHEYREMARELEKELSFV